MKKQGKQGVSLVEVIVAIFILSIVVVAVVGTIGLARRSVLENNVKDASVSAAQAVIDTLIQELSTTATIDITALETACGATFSATDSFDFTNGERQFTYEPANGNTGYKITAVVFYEGGESYTRLMGYASIYGENFIAG